LKWDIVKDKDATIAWLDTWDTADTANLRPFKVGHFPGMNNVSTKCSLGRTLNAARNVFPNVRDAAGRDATCGGGGEYEPRVDVVRHRARGSAPLLPIISRLIFPGCMHAHVSSSITSAAL
jgi:hypothetical protein